jgi:uncharacterized protein (TIGR02391 family)
MLTISDRELQVSAMDENISFPEDLLHPLIKQHAYPQFKDGRLRNAVLDALISVYDLIRERSSLELDGSNLIERAFSLTDPRLIISNLDSESGRNEQKGFIEILKGAYSGVRNVNAHSLQNNLDSQTAAQYLVLASLLAKKVYSASLGNFLRPDGIYLAKSTGSMRCLRFYDDRDKTVLGVSLTECRAAGMVLEWLNKDNAAIRGYGQGSYSQDGNKVTFVTRSSAGEISYSGIINGLTLELYVQSRINGNCSSAEFEFWSKNA